MNECTAARFVKQEFPEPVRFPLEIELLVEQRFSRRRQNTTGDDSSDFTFRMATDNGNRFFPQHGVRTFSSFR